MPSPIPAEDDTFVPFTKAERIRQLNDIDHSITQLLKSAGLALQILATSQESARSVPERKEAFKKATDSYLSTLHTVDIGLKRQILGLEEAEITIEKKVKDSQDTANGDKGQERNFDGGTGKLDIGWLNSRSGKVGRDNEAELWEKARTFLEDVDKNWGHAKAQSEEDQDMGS